MNSLSIDLRPPRWLFWISLLAGLVLAFEASQPDRVQPLVVIQVLRAVVLAGLLCIGPVARRLNAAVRWIDALGSRGRWGAMLLIWAGASAYLPLNAVHAGRVMQEQLHDELSYRLMARIFASGHLVMPPHPLGEALGSFHILTQPAYGSVYFPGTGLLYAPALLTGVPTWLVAAIISGFCVAMIFRISAEAIRPSIALMGPLILLSIPHTRWFGLNVMSHMPLLATVLACVWFYAMWARTRRLKYVAAMSAAAGFALITRPFDALLLLSPLAIAVLVQAASRGGPRAFLRCTLAGVGPAVPFVVLQLCVNHAFTGSWTRTPHDLHTDRFFPGVSIGFSTLPPPRAPDTVLEQKREFFEHFVAPSMAQNQSLDAALSRPVLRERWNAFSTAQLPRLWLLAFAPLGLVVALRAWTWPVVAGTIVLPLGYVFYAFFPSWYTTGLTLGFVLILLAGLGGVLGRIAHPTARNALLIAVAAAMVNIPVLSPGPDEFGYPQPEYLALNRLIEQDVPPGSIVFIRYASGSLMFHNEPVYNTQTAWPDDAAVVRLHAISPETDLKAVQYYRHVSPARTVYWLDRRTGRLTRIGTLEQAESAFRSAMDQEREPAP